MTGDQLRRLTENIARDGELTSFPLVYKPDKKLNPDFYEQSQGELIILSGNHRVEAAKAAGLTHSNVIEIKTPLPDDRLRAIQLSHNSINGQDDPSVLLQLYETLSLDEKLYSGITDDDFNIDPIDVASLGCGKLTYAQVELAFLPTEVQDVKDWLDHLDKAGRGKDHLVAAYKDFDRFFDTVVRTKKQLQVYNSAIAFSMMVQLATERLDQLEEDQEKNDG